MEKRLSRTHPNTKEVRVFKDTVTGAICKIYINDDWAWYNGKYYTNYKNARARLSKLAKGPLIRIDIPTDEEQKKEQP